MRSVWTRRKKLKPRSLFTAKVFKGSSNTRKFQTIVLLIFVFCWCSVGSERTGGFLLVSLL